MFVGRRPGDVRAALDPNYTNAVPNSLPTDTGTGARLVALDTTSTLLSVAVGSPGHLEAERSRAASRSSAAIMQLLDDCLKDAGVSVDEIPAVLVLRGPGSFTGLRVGLALAQGLRQALGVAAGTVSTLETLAAVPQGSAAAVIAAVSSGRHSWIAQRFDLGAAPVASGSPHTATDAELLELSVDTPVIGFGLERISTAGVHKGELLTPPPLAAIAIDLSHRADWSAASLTDPLYLAPPPADPRAASRS